jgi:WD40 repeat protein
MSTVTEVTEFAPCGPDRPRFPSPGGFPMKKILILSSNPKDTPILDLDREIRDIEEGLRRSKNRDNFTIDTRGAVRAQDLIRAMLDIDPDIVHFCGHGTGERGIVLEDDQGNMVLASTEALLELCRIFADRVECVLLNACYSEEQADAIVEHINYAIGMNRAVRDDAAIAFSVGFYDALGAGKSIEKAFEIGRASVMLIIDPKRPTQERKLVPDGEENEKSSDASIPILKKKKTLSDIKPADPAKPVSSGIVSPDRSLKGHSEWIRSLAFSADGQILVSGSNDKTTRIWDVQTGQLLHNPILSKQRVKSVAISPDSQTIASGSADNIIHLLDRTTGKIQRSIDISFNPGSILNVVAIDPQGKVVVSGSFSVKGKVKFWNLATGKQENEIIAHHTSVLALAFSTDAEILFSASAAGTIKAWGTGGRNDRPLYTIDPAHSGEICALAVTNDNQTLISAGADRTIKLWDLATGTPKSPHILQGHAGRVWDLAIAADGERMISASADYTVKIWEMATGAIRQTFTSHIGEVRAISLHPDSKTIASAGHDLDIKFWQI